MKKLSGSLVLGWLLVASAPGAAYKEGERVLDKTYKVDILKMQWGISGERSDRLLGKVRLYTTTVEEAYSDISLTFDVYSKKAVSNEVADATASTGGRRPPKPKKIDTIEVTFNFRKYGFRETPQYVEGDFCVDFAKKADASKLLLVNVKVLNAPVTYQTTFNINSALLRTLYTLPEPKVQPAKK